MTKKQSVKPAKFKIHERLNELPVPKKSKTINLLHPPKDMTMEELEGYWGKPDPNEPSIRERMKKANIPLYPKRKVNPF